MPVKGKGAQRLFFLCAAPVPNAPRLEKLLEWGPLRPPIIDYSPPEAGAAAGAGGVGASDRSVKNGGSFRVKAMAALEEAAAEGEEAAPPPPPRSAGSNRHRALVEGAVSSAALEALTHPRGRGWGI